MCAQRRIRVFVVEANRQVCQQLEACFAHAADVELVGVSGHPLEARARLKLALPDVVLLGLGLPGVDGLTFLKHLLRLDPRRVLMLAAEHDAVAAIAALELGAVGLCPVPLRRERELLEAVRRAARTSLEAPQVVLPAPLVRAVSCEGAPAARVETLEASLGVAGLVQRVRALPTGSAAVAKTELEGLFAQALVDRLDEVAAVDVRLAREGSRLNEGVAWVLPADSRLAVVQRGARFFFELEAQSSAQRAPAAVSASPRGPA